MVTTDGLADQLRVAHQIYFGPRNDRSGGDREESKEGRHALCEIIRAGWGPIM